MNRNRLVLRLVLLAVAIAIFFSRGYQHNPQAVRGFAFALVFAGLFLAIRVFMESSKRKKLEQERQSATGKDVELFTKPKEF